MVVQKAFTLAGLCKRNLVNGKNVDGSDDIFKEQTPNSSPERQQSEINNKGALIKTSNVTLQVGDGSFISVQNGDGKNHLLNSQSFINQYGFCQSKLDAKMTSDTDNIMTEPNSTNYASEAGEAAQSPSPGSAKSGLSRRQRKNCRKREKIDLENKNLGLASIKSNDSIGLPGSSNQLSGSSSSLNSQKEGIVGPVKKRSSGSLKDREGYGRYSALETYDRLQGMSDQQIYYWIYSYCLDLTRLRHLGFPLDSELHPGKAIIYVDPDIGIRSCTQGGGDLTSLEFCVDDFSSTDVKPASISAVNQSLQSAPENINFITIQKGLGNGSEQLEGRSSALSDHVEESQKNTQNKNKEEDNDYQETTGIEDTENLSSTDEENNASSLTCARVNPPHPTGILDVNAQEFVPGSSITTEALSVTSRDSTSATLGLSASAKEFIPSSSYSNSSPLSASLNASENEVEVRHCARCDKVFEVVDGIPISREKCLYHWGKKWHYEKTAEEEYSSNKKDDDKSTSSQSHPSHSKIKSKLQFTCCNARALAQGCCTAKCHVWRGKIFSSTGMHGPFTGYVRTKKRKHSPPNGYHGIYAIDCEMCYTTNGMEIARLSVVGIDGRPIYDSLIQPETPIIDYNTRFSGLTERDFRRGEKDKALNTSSSAIAIGPPVKSLREVQNDLMGFISASTIIVGHGLENDFRALMLVHSLVVDTSTLYPHFFGLPYRRSLKSLAKSYLKRDIQTGTHDSLEDARASLELVLCQVKAESEGMSNALKGNKDTNASSYSQHSISPPFSQLGNTNALLNASIGEMNRSGILFNSAAMNPGVLPHVSSGGTPISPVSTFMSHMPGIK